eukprot:SAG31_NODE_258_length_18937_cov_61.688555_19_plen_233_part_00
MGTLMCAAPAPRQAGLEQALHSSASLGSSVCGSLSSIGSGIEMLPCPETTSRDPSLCSSDTVAEVSGIRSGSSASSGSLPSMGSLDIPILNMSSSDSRSYKRSDDRRKSTLAAQPPSDVDALDAGTQQLSDAAGMVRQMAAIDLTSTRTQPPHPENRLRPLTIEVEINDGSGRTKKMHHCPYEGCTYSAAGTGHLFRHMRIHTGEKPFVVCPPLSLELSWCIVYETCFLFFV